MIIIYRIYQFTIMWPLMLVATVITALATIIGCMLGGGRWWGYYPEVTWSRVICWLSWVRVSVEGRENISKDTSYVFVCNHQGAYDIFSVYGWLGHNFRWMMKAPLRKIPLVGYACYKAHQVFVDNTSPSAIRRTMEAAERIIHGGMSIVVFPEGSRSRTGKMGRFKRGAYILATEGNMPVVPVTIDGAYDVMPRQAKLPRPGRIHLTIHKPINPPEDGYDLPKLMEQTHAIIHDSLSERYY